MILKIHPAIGIARLGNAPDAFYLAPENEGDLPIVCDTEGVPARDAQGKDQPVRKFVDDQGRVLRQAARFRVFVYDDAHPEGRELRIGDTLRTDRMPSGSITGQTFEVKVKDIQWTVYLANKKAVWYQFQETQGEHGYDPNHPLRNPSITEPSARQKLIIDPGPRTVQYTVPAARHARLAQGQNPGVPQTFPPPLVPSSISTLGEIKCHQDGDFNRLVVLGGHGNSGSCLTDFGQPYITEYANNDGWFDDTSDGPVHATLVVDIVSIDGKTPDPKIYPASRLRNRSIPVDVPAWTIVGYPRYAPQITDIVTLNDVAYDVAVRQFGFNPAMYGKAPFDASRPLPKTQAEWTAWRTTASWNPDYYPYFERDIWPILRRPAAYGAVMYFDTDIGGDPHDVKARGNFDKSELSTPPNDKETPEQREKRKAMRRFLYDVLRKPGQENDYRLGSASGRSPKGAIGMPWLCGDNPLSNTAPSKFLRLTDTMLFLLRQWAEGKFVSESVEGIPAPAFGAARDLDRGALANALGGSFCPGAEVSWIIRNPAIYAGPYRIHESSAYSAGNLSQTGNLTTGLEPGDLTKYSALPWQSDFNECATQPIDITFRDWNTINPSSTGDPVVSDLQTTFWWPAHRPMRVNTYDGQSVPWSGSIPQTPLGDLQMVTAWSSLPFIVDGTTVAP